MWVRVFVASGFSRFIGLARTIYIRRIYCNFGRGITKYTVIYGVCIRFWPTLQIYLRGTSDVLARTVYVGLARTVYMHRI